MALETPEEFYARVAAATDEEGRLPVAVEEMPGWDIFPYEIDSLRIKPLRPLADEEPPRRAEDAQDCWCTDPAAQVPIAGTAWRNDRWRLVLSEETRVPAFVILEPLTHCDLATVPSDLAAEMGRLVVEVAAALEELPTVARAQLLRFGDGGAHLHLMFLGRPRRILQFRGSPLLDWEENLPSVPVEVHRANAAYVGNRLVERVGGDGPDWGPAA
jgi:diadenosine tetraphosphate (Ap4A) HIT family hydrolase